MGRHLLPELGETPIKCVSRVSRDGASFWLRGTILDPSCAQELVKGSSTLIHMAAQLAGGDVYRTNVVGTENMIEACRKEGVKRIVHLSSVGVVGLSYSRRKIVVDENTRCSPQNEYEKSKLQAEELWRNAARDYGFELTIVRPTNVFGENHPQNQMLDFLKHVLSGRRMPYSMDAVLNFVYVRDVAAAIAWFARKGGAGVWNIGDTVKFDWFYREVCSQLDTRPNRLSLPGPAISLMDCLGYGGFSSIRERLTFVTNRVEYSARKLHQAFTPSYGLQAGLRNTITYYRSVGKL
ncbi:MAG: NAD(P)-dependent oxidoreductase [Leptospirales bacterium]|nr:NAD(P)-dependent oxidoreductase [Leptospirales bacterium]